MTFAMIAGCSHTAGTGNNLKDCYVSLLENYYGFPIYNWGVPGAGGEEVLTKVVTCVNQSSRPEFIIAQWPNPFRKMFWINGHQKTENVNTGNEVFNAMVKYGDENFYEPWIQSIIVASLLCKLAHIPLINIMLENIDQVYHTRLAAENIVLYVDEKLPGHTWLFDSAAQDSLHHSPMCHAQWAERLTGIINEYTAR